MKNVLKFLLFFFALLAIQDGKGDLKLGPEAGINSRFLNLKRIIKMQLTNKVFLA